MGATNCPETPRQRLISMMYLVLTALLALNVSKDILNAFAVVDETLQTSNQITESKNYQDYGLLDRQKEILGEDKVADVFGKAMQLKEFSNEIVSFIEQLKKDYIEYVDGESPLNPDGTVKSVAQLRSKDNISKATAFMNDGHAKELKSRIEKYREQLLAFVDENDKEAMSKTIGLDVNEKFKNANGAPESWETHYFEGVIFAAGVTLLNKLVGEVRNAESVILKNLIRSITKDDYNFSEVKAKVIPKSQLVFQGEGYEAEVIVAAYDDKKPFEVYWRSGSGELSSPSGANFIKGEDGVAKLKIGTGSVGDFGFTGFVSMIGADGLKKTYPFSDKYMVMAPSATVAAEKMNVLYAGLENPVSVSASVSAEKTSISVGDGATSVKTGPGNYNVSVPESLIGRTVTITVHANVGDKNQTMGSTTFRVKRVPDPVAVLGGGFKGGKTTKPELLANPFVFANMGDFAYDLKWTVNSYNVTFIIKGIEDAPIPCTGNQFSDALKNKINSCSPGTLIFFDNIKVSCVAGSRTLNPISVILK